MAPPAKDTQIPKVDILNGELAWKGEIPPGLVDLLNKCLKEWNGLLAVDETLQARIRTVLKSLAKEGCIYQEDADSQEWRGKAIGRNCTNCRHFPDFSKPVWQRPPKSSLFS